MHERGYSGGGAGAYGIGEQPSTHADQAQEARTKAPTQPTRRSGWWARATRVRPGDAGTQPTRRCGWWARATRVSGTHGPSRTASRGRCLSRRPGPAAAAEDPGGLGEAQLAPDRRCGTAAPPAPRQARVAGRARRPAALCLRACGWYARGRRGESARRSTLPAGRHKLKRVAPPPPGATQFDTRACRRLPVHTVNGD